ncbi:MAG: DMT family transporter [Pseudomonadota bacterium]
MSDIAIQEEDRTLEGIGWMVATTLFFVAVTGIVRYLGSDLPAAEGAFLRYVIGLIMLVPFVGPLLKSPPNGKEMLIFGIRGTIHGVAVCLWFFAMARIPIAEVTAIGYTAPIFVALGAALFLGEKMKLRRITAIAIAFIGTLVILRPGLQEISYGHLAQLCAAPCFATSFLIAKRLTSSRDAISIVFMLSLWSTAILFPLALLEWRNPTWEEIFWLSLTAFFATAGHWTMTRAFACAPITVTQPAQFLQLVWAVILGMVMFGEALDPFVILGGGIVVASATYISHREAVAARQARTPPAVATKV